MAVLLPAFWIMVAQLHTEMECLLNQLLQQGVLDGEFLHLRDLEDEINPNFLYDIVTVYFGEMEDFIKILGELLSKNDETTFNYIKVYVNRMIESSSCIGAKRINNVCFAILSTAQHSSRLGCLRALYVLEQEYSYLKKNLAQFFLRKQQRSLAIRVGFPSP